MPTVDVIIPAYGRIAHLREAIESVSCQTFTDWHLYIVDDASPEPIRDTLAADARTTVITNSVNLGPAASRNIGVAAGDSPLIAFLDSDDLWHAEKLERQVHLMSGNRSAQWCHTNETWYRSGNLVKQKAMHRKQAGQFFERALERCLVSPSAVMLRRDFFTASGGFAPAFRLCEDFELWLRLLLQEPILYDETALTIKRAGDWAQLSTAREIDRYRVLALHRLWRLSRDKMPDSWLEALLSQAELKSQWLLQGAERHGNTARAGVYQAWFTLFKTLRTRPMR